MNVEELIKILKTFPQKSIIYMADMKPVLAIHNINYDIIITDEK